MVRCHRCSSWGRRPWGEFSRRFCIPEYYPILQSIIYPLTILTIWPAIRHLSNLSLDLFYVFFFVNNTVSISPRSRRSNHFRQTFLKLLISPEFFNPNRYYFKYLEPKQITVICNSQPTHDSKGIPDSIPKKKTNLQEKQ